MKKFALITGASAGLGKAFAVHCAERGMNLLLASLAGENLPRLCGEISLKYGVEAAWRECDLTQDGEVANLADWALQRGRINLLINNAGYGGAMSMESASYQYLDNMINLNVRKTAMLTFLILPELKSHKEAFILNVSSIIGFTPSAYKTLYPATKAFVYNFSRGLNEELKGSGVHVGVLMAGPMPTTAAIRTRLEKQGWKGRLLTMEPEMVAGFALRKLFAKKPVIIPGMINRLTALIFRILPVAWQLPLVSRVIARELQPAKGSG